MNFQLDDEQSALRDAVERLLRERYDWSRRKANLALPLGTRAPIWREFAQLGLLGLLIPESHGGAGRTMVDLGLVMEEFGKALVVEPFAMTAVNAVACLRRAASAEQQARHLPNIAAGEVVMAVASPDLQDLSAPPIRARRQGGAWVLQGRAETVAGADIADALIIDAALDHEEGASARGLFVVDGSSPGLRLERHKRHDGARGADVILSDVRAASGDRLAGGAAVAAVMTEVRGVAIAAACGEAVGAMSAALDLTLDYLRTRNQFGAPLASFQAVQHRAVELLVALERARSMAILAYVAADEPASAGRAAKLSAAKIQIGQSARFVGQQVIQLHGGMGMTDEYAAGHYFRRLTALELSLGGVEQHLTALSRLGGVLAHA